MNLQICNLFDGAVRTLLFASVLMSPIPRTDAAVNFIQHVRPVLEESCVSCHGPEKSKGDMRLDTREGLLKGGAGGAAIVPGDAAASELVRRVSLPQGHDDVMPNKGRALTSHEIGVLSAWIDDGARWTDGVALINRKKTSRQELEPSGNAEKRYTLNRELDPASSAQLDRLIAEDNSQREGLVTSPVVDDLAFLRRASVDLIGRIPTYEEITAYLKADSLSDTRRQEAVERLIRDPRFNDRWATFFADMMRIRSGAQGGAQFLGYIHKSLEVGTPYDIVAQTLISANGSPGNTPAVGFVLGENVDPMALAASTAQTFLGVRMGCAQCHDHPFDKWTQKDFYEFAGFFGKTTRVEQRRTRDVFTTEADEMSVKWPPEDKAEPEARKPVHPSFPFAVEPFAAPPNHIVRFEKIRATFDAEVSRRQEKQKLEQMFDDLARESLDDDALGMIGSDIREDVRSREREIDTRRERARESELRKKLAERVASPYNRHFSRSFVNRLWAELLGHGFYTPLDDYRDSTQVSHPLALEYAADEFVASGFDFKSLVRLIILSEAYQRSALGTVIDREVRETSEAYFAAAAPRRLNGEALYDSMVTAGHLTKQKWPAGANIVKVIRRERYFEEVPLEMRETGPASLESDLGGDDNEAVAMMNQVTTGVVGGYELESGTPIDFSASDSDDIDVFRMRAMSEDQIEMQLDKKQEKAPVVPMPNAPARIEKIREIEDSVDDNPSFGSAYRIASPAPPAHFLRIFGQPGRAQLGEFRDSQPSMRQQLLMLNGKISHEAARVGPLEPMYALLTVEAPMLEAAIQRAYLETLTRRPTTEEREEARAQLAAAANALEGMADLRWALLNSHAFRYLY